jgi:hypothetical protein
MILALHGTTVFAISNNAAEHVPRELNSDLGYGGGLGSVDPEPRQLRLGHVLEVLASHRRSVSSPNSLPMIANGGGFSTAC